jgi:hypothetical protein
VWFELFGGLLNVETHDVWNGNVTTTKEVQTKHIHFLGFGDIREKMTLQNVILRRLRCMLLKKHIDMSHGAIE